MNSITEKNKAVVIRFNRECIEQGKPASFHELLAEDVVNHAAPPGAPNGFGSFTHFINEVLRKGFSEVQVQILQQVAEGDLVCTRKRITGRHTGEIFGIPPSHKTVDIRVIDIIRLKDGRYAEHWAQHNFDEVLKEVGLPG
jgi:predicted SnoaL-like aldol condensation-catalyzing enzyme